VWKSYCVKRLQNTEIEFEKQTYLNLKRLLWMDETSGVTLALKTGVASYPSRLPKLKTACRAEGSAEAGGRQNSFTDPPANR
jgi:hypothetical protein